MQQTSINTDRASFQRLNGNIRVGAKNRNPYLSQSEIANLRNAINKIDLACKATNDTLAMSRLREAFQTLRTIILDNK